MLAGILASLLLHALLLLLPGWRDSSSKPLTGLEINLAPAPPLPPLEKPESKPEPQIETEPKPTLQEPTILAETPPEISLVETAETTEPAEPEPAAPSSGIVLRERVLALIAQDQGPTEAQRNALEPAALPRLPDSSGWLNDYVGEVQARVDRWESNDGGRHTRIVLANGQVICGRADSPTSAEMFNPSMAMNIMRFANCGRERPTPVDRSDPWLRQ